MGRPEDVILVYPIDIGRRLRQDVLGAQFSRVGIVNSMHTFLFALKIEKNSEILFQCLLYFHGYRLLKKIQVSIKFDLAIFINKSN